MTRGRSVAVVGLVWVRLWPALAAGMLASCDPCSGVLACGEPVIRYEGQLVNEFREDDPPGGLRVEFIRTGGVELVNPTLSATSDSTGRFVLTGRARSEGQVVGDLVVHTIDPIPPLRRSGVTLATAPVASELRYLGAVPVPVPVLRAVGELYYRGTGQPAAGLRVEFRRTGGIAATPDTFRRVSDAMGRFYLNPRVREYGELRGELRVTPIPPERPFVIGDVRLTPVLTDTPTRLVGRWGVGAHLPYAGLLRWADTFGSAAGVEVEVHRTGGVPVQPERYLAVTNGAGTFALSPTPLSSGEVELELIVRPPAPYRSVTISGVKLATVEEDRPSQLVGQWFIPR